MREKAEKTFLDRIPDIVFRLDQAGKVLYLNDAWECWTGIPKEEMEGEPFLDQLPSPERDEFHSAFQDLREKKDAKKDLTLRLKNGEEAPRSFQLRMMSHEEPEGAGLYIEGSAREEKSIRETVPESSGFKDLVHNMDEGWARTWSERLAMFPERAPIPLIECGSEGGINYLNPVAFDLLNEHGEVGALDFLPLQHVALVEEVFRTGMDLERELELDSRTYNWLYSRVEGSSTVHVRGSDITEQKRREAELLDSIVSTQEEERDRFATELHEGIGQYLTAILMHFEAMQEGLGKEHQEKVHHVQDLIQEAMKSVRGISYGLMPRMLKQFGLLPTLENLCGRVQERYGLKVELDPEFDEARLDERTEVGIYRIVMELLEVSVHSRKAEVARLKMRDEGKQILLEYADDGKEGDTSGSVLNDMKRFNSRIRSLNGRMELWPEGGEAFPIKIRFPV